MKQNALSRVQRPAQPAVSSISKRSGREDRSKPREPEDRLAQLSVTGDEPGSIMSHANKKTTMRKPIMDAAKEANPPRPSSPALEISKSAKTGMPNSGRATRATLAVESLSHLKPNGSDPAPKLTKPRVDVIEEEKIDKEGDDEHAGWAEALHRQLKLQYIRTRSDTTEAKELLYGRVASGTLFQFATLCPRPWSPSIAIASSPRVSRRLKIRSRGTTCLSKTR